MLEAFKTAVAAAVEDHIRTGRAMPIYKDGALIAIKLKTSSLYGEMRKSKKNICRFWRS